MRNNSTLPKLMLIMLMTILMLANTADASIYSTIDNHINIDIQEYKNSDTNGYAIIINNNFNEHIAISVMHTNNTKTNLGECLQSCTFLYEKYKHNNNNENNNEILEIVNTITNKTLIKVPIKIVNNIVNDTDVNDNNEDNTNNNDDISDANNHNDNEVNITDINDTHIIMNNTVINNTIIDGDIFKFNNSYFAGYAINRTIYATVNDYLVNMYFTIEDDNDTLFVPLTNKTTVIDVMDEFESNLHLSLYEMSDLLAIEEIIIDEIPTINITEININGSTNSTNNNTTINSSINTTINVTENNNGNNNTINNSTSISNKSTNANSTIEVTSQNTMYIVENETIIEVDIASIREEVLNEKTDVEKIDIKSVKLINNDGNNTEIITEQILHNNSLELTFNNSAITHGKYDLVITSDDNNTFITNTISIGAKPIVHPKTNKAYFVGDKITNNSELLTISDVNNEIIDGSATLVNNKTINVKIEKNTIKEMDIRGENIGNLLGGNLKLEPVVNETNKSKNWVNLYAVDPTKINVTNITVTVTAKGTELYKCAMWNFTTETCFGEWVFLQNTTPGKEYTILINNKDPAFGEIANYTTNTCSATFGTACSLWPASSEDDNTFDSCPTSTGGSNDEHVNEVTINATTAYINDSVEISCEIDPYSTGTEEYIYYYNSTGWKQIYSGSAPGGNIHTLSRNVTLDNVTGTHWFRCIVDWDGENDECASGSYFDNDDVSIKVINKPVIMDITFINPRFNETQILSNNSTEFSVTITDDWKNENISWANATIVNPDGISKNISLVQKLNSTGGKTSTWIANITDTSKIGMYNITHLWAGINWYNKSSIVLPNVVFIVNQPPKISDYLQMEWGVVNNVGDTWIKINTNKTYVKPIIVSSPHYIDNGVPTVTRIKNINNNSFEIKQQIAAPNGVPTPRDLYYLVIEEGLWTLPNGNTIEALSYNDTITDTDSSWVGEKLNVKGTYTNPVVLGQVMTFNDPRWSVFWASNGKRNNPPTSTNIYTGKHVGQDHDDTRLSETIGVIIQENGHGMIDVNEFDAVLTGNSVRGIDNTPPFDENFNAPFTMTPSIAIVASAAMNGANGGWPAIYGNAAFSNNAINLTYDEYDSGERSHTSEQVALMIFDVPGSYSNAIIIHNTSFNMTQVELGKNISLIVNTTDEQGNTNMTQVKATLKLQDGRIVVKTLTPVLNLGIKTGLWTTQINETDDIGFIELNNITVNSPWYNIVETYDNTNVKVIYTIGDMNINTDRNVYSRNNLMKFNATGFTPNKNITYTIKQPNTNIVDGYPINISADNFGKVNNNHTIGNTDYYGPYTIILTDNYNPSNTVNTIFKVVSGTINLSKTTATQGDKFNITGKYWNKNEIATIIIKNIADDEVFHEFNYTTNEYGEINITLNIPYNYTIGQYDIIITQPNKQAKATITINKKETNINTDSSWYRRHDTMIINGDNYVPSTDITLTIKNSSDNDIDTYPKIIAVNESGMFTHIYNINSIDVGKYTINAKDNVYNNIADTKIVNIVNEYVTTTQSAYGTGEIVILNGKYWTRNTNINVDVRNSSGSILGYPKILVTNENGTFTDNLTAPTTGLSVTEYTINVTEQVTSSYSSEHKFNVTGLSTLETNAPSYSNYTDVTIIGSHFSNDASASIRIKSIDTNGTILSYPKTIYTNGVGEFSHIWNTENYCEGEYLIEAEDNIFTELLKANNTFFIKYTDDTEKTCTDQWGFNCGTGPAESSDNTFDSCANGIGNDESIEDIILNVTKTYAGNKVKVSCEIDPYTSNDFIRISYYNGTGWKQLYNEGPMGDASTIIRNATFTTDNITGTHWVRCSIGYQTSADTDECIDTGNYYDNDDISFEVIEKPTSCTEADGKIPYVKINETVNNNYTIATHINISTVATDENSIKEVKAIITTPNNMEYEYQCTNSGDNYWIVFNETLLRGEYNVNVIAKDMWNNINSTSDTFNIIYDNLSISTNKQSYIGGDNLIITSYGYDANSNVELRIFKNDLLLDGFPLPNTTNSNGTFVYELTIPLNTELGLYKINTIQTSNTTRTINTTFDVVTAIIDTEGNIFEQGDLINITGIKWETNSNVTINLTDKFNNSIIAPFNVTSDSEGTLRIENIHIPYNTTIGSASINAIDTTNVNKNNQHSITIKSRSITLSSNYEWFKNGDNMIITAIGYSNNSNITTYIINSSGNLINGYPINETSNINGEVDHHLVIDDKFSIGDVNITLRDSLYNNLEKTITLKITEESLNTDTDFYKLGDSVHFNGKSWERNSDVELTLRNSTGGIVSGFPKIITTNANGEFSYEWIAALGTLDNEETYNIYAEQIGETYENASLNINVIRASTLYTNKYEYNANEIVSIGGNTYTANSNVEMKIGVLNGGLALNFPKTIVSESDGSIVDTWNTINYCAGEYEIHSTDLTFPDDKNAQTTFIIKHGDDSPRNCVDEWGFDCGIGPAESDDNTFDTCENGQGGDESVENIELNASIIGPTDQMEVTCTFDPYTTNDYINIWYYNGTGWRRLFNEGPIGSSSNIQRSTVFTPDNVTGTHWIRCSIGYQTESDNDECTNTGNYYDNDDISFEVANFPTNCIEIDSENPSVSELTPNNVNLDTERWINISARITDNDILTNTTLKLTLPNTTEIEFEMKDNNGDDLYNVSMYISEEDYGLYEYSIYSRDDTWNINDSEHGNFTILNPDRNTVINFISPTNNTIDYDGNFNINYNITESNSQYICDLLIDGEINKTETNRIKDTTYTYNVIDLTGGDHTLQITCTNNNTKNIINTEIYNVRVERFDIIVDEAEITFNPKQPIDGHNTTVNVVIKNNEGTDATAVMITIRDKTIDEDVFTGTRNIMGNSNVTINVNHLFALGEHELEVIVDSFDTINEINETNNYANKMLYVSSWTTIYGTINASLAITNSDYDALYSWNNLDNVSVFVVDSDANIDWTNLQAITRTKDNLSSTNDFAEIDQLFGLAGKFDNVTNTYGLGTQIPANTTDVNVYGKTIADVPIKNSTINDNFITGILWDTSSDTNNEFDIIENEDLIFVTQMNKNKLGKYGVYDYEINVPAKLQEQKGVTQQLTVYVEIK